jgi:hypothetical protein
VRQTRTQGPSNTRRTIPPTKTKSIAFRLEERRLHEYGEFYDKICEFRIRGFTVSDNYPDCPAAIVDES